MYRRTTRQRIALAALLALSATVVTLDFRQNPGGPVRRVQDWAVSIVAPLQDGVARVFQPVGDFLTSIGELASLRGENARLRERVQDLEAQQRRFPEIARENESMLALLQERDWTKGQTLGARVIGVGPSNYEWTIFIDKGIADGLREGMSVVSAEGLVGRISLVSADYSKVLLVIDPDHAVGARLTVTGETGVVGGRGDEDMRLDLIDAEIDVGENETVVTSGYDGGVYPAGIPIGRVTRVTTSASGLEKTAFVRPFVDFSKLDLLKILLDSGPMVPVNSPG